MMLDDPKAIMKKFKRAVTDSDSDVVYDVAKKPGVSSLLDILAAATDARRTRRPRATPSTARSRTTRAKPSSTLLEPIQDRYKELMEDQGELARLLRVGSDRARAVASVTLRRAYDAIGILPA